MKIKIFKMDDYEWGAAESLEQAKNEYLGNRDDKIIDSKWYDEQLDNCLMGIAVQLLYDYGVDKVNASKIRPHINKIKENIKAWADKRALEGSLVIGDYTISRKDSGIWITRNSGEGGEFCESDISKVIDKFYKEHF